VIVGWSTANRPLIAQAKPHRTPKILGHARRRSSRVAARRARAQQTAMPRAFNDDRISGTVRACYRVAIPG